MPKQQSSKFGNNNNNVFLISSFQVVFFAHNNPPPAVAPIPFSMTAFTTMSPSSRPRTEFTNKSTEDLIAGKTGMYAYRTNRILYLATNKHLPHSLD